MPPNSLGEHRLHQPYVPETDKFTICFRERFNLWDPYGDTAQTTAPNESHRHAGGFGWSQEKAAPRSSTRHSFTRWLAQDSRGPSAWQGPHADPTPAVFSCSYNFALIISEHSARHGTAVSAISHRMTHPASRREYGDLNSSR